MLLRRIASDNLVPAAARSGQHLHPSAPGPNGPSAGRSVWQKLESGLLGLKIGWAGAGRWGTGEEDSEKWHLFPSGGPDLRWVPPSLGLEGPRLQPSSLVVGKTATHSLPLPPSDRFSNPHASPCQPTVGLPSAHRVLSTTGSEALPCGNTTALGYRPLPDSAG